MKTNKYVYRYTDPSTNEVIYVGQGSSANFKRAYSHLKRTDNHPFANRLAKMKANNIEPLIEILITGIDAELADLIEIELIDTYGRKVFGSGTLLNITEGGCGIKDLPEESRKRISEAIRNRSQETKDKIRQFMKERKLTDEHKRKISETLKGHSVSEETRKKMSAAKKGKTGQVKSPETIEKLKQAWVRRKQKLGGSSPGGTKDSTKL